MLIIKDLSTGGKAALGASRFAKLMETDEVSEDYPVPQYEDNPECIFSNSNDVLVYLENKTDEPYSIYWANKDSNNIIKFVEVFHTDDGNVVIGNSFQDKIVISMYNSSFKI